jgi:hypothetical protein
MSMILTLIPSGAIDKSKINFSLKYFHDQNRTGESLHIKKFKLNIM